VGFDEGYRRMRVSPAHAGMVGEGLPAAVQPFSFVPLGGMEYVLAALLLRPGQTLVDLGCGRGGPGLWLAGEARAGLIGIDGSEVAVADARERARLFPGVSSARFEVADVTATGLPQQIGDAAVSIDVLQLVDDQPAMLREMARLLRPGGRAVLTTWEGFGRAPARMPRDTRALFKQAGFADVAVIERPAWQRRQHEIYDRAVETDDGSDPAITDLANEARTSGAYRDYLRRVVVAARR
jgi:SAM-dependent methyltransferase